MTKTSLDRLIVSLTTIIVRWHDSQLTHNRLIKENRRNEILNIITQSRSIAEKILEEDNYLEQLDKIITDVKNYALRLPLLKYLEHEINVLYKLRSQQEPFTPAELINYKNTLTQLLSDLYGLLKTKKGEVYHVTYSTPLNKSPSEPINKDAIHGLTNDGYTGGIFCNSGDLLLIEIATIIGSEETIRLAAESICNEHQNALLIHQFTSENIQLQKKCDLLTEAFQAYELKISTLNEKLTQAEEVNKELHHSIATLNTTIETKNGLISKLSADKNLSQISSSTFFNNHMNDNKNKFTFPMS